MKKSGSNRNIKITSSIIVILLLAAIFTKYFGGTKSTQSILEAQQSEVVELNDGDSFELSMEMITKELSGQKVTMMGYNGSIPGPTIKVKQNSTIKVNFINNTEFENTLHSHGVRMENAFDGVPTVTQKPVQPGESFEYKLNFKDPGVYWYHPHMREDMTQEMGLYGAFVVEPEDENYWNDVNGEQYIFLDDYLMTENGLYPFYKDTITHSLMGRYGNQFLINGQANYSFTTTKNSTIRFTLLNVANARPFNISIEDLELKLVGSDGGKFEKESRVKNIVIGPSERYIFEAYFDKPGIYDLQHVTPGKTYKLGEITILDEASQSDGTPDKFEGLNQTDYISESIPDFASYLDQEPDKRLQLNIEMAMMGGQMGHNMSGMMGAEASGDGIEWEDDMMMNQMADNELIQWKIIDKQTGAVNEEIDWEYAVGDYVTIEIDNTRDSAHPMQHPIHFHGQRFVILSTDGVENKNLVWKDTVMIPAGSTEKILLEVSNPGKWMAHCHIAEHLHNGMMFDFEVTN